MARAEAVRRRLRPEDRKAAILRGAISFFAKYGVQAQTRDLARSLGVTQPLLYRYFPSKEDLIEAVYNDLFVARWKPEWEETLADRTVPLLERLNRFYQDYMSVVFQYEWIRIYLYSGLAGSDINRRYIKTLERKILKRICVELNHEFFDKRGGNVSAHDMEEMWNFHGGLFYAGIRRFVYGMEAIEPMDKLIVRSIDSLLQSWRERAG